MSNGEPAIADTRNSYSYNVIDYYQVIKPANVWGDNAGGNYTADNPKVNRPIYLCRNLNYNIGNDLGHMGLRYWDIEYPYGFTKDNTDHNYVISTININSSNNYGLSNDDIRWLCECEADIDTIAAYTTNSFSFRGMWSTTTYATLPKMSRGDLQSKVNIEYNYNAPSIKIEIKGILMPLIDWQIRVPTRYLFNDEVAVIDPYSFGDGFFGLFAYNKLGINTEEDSQVVASYNYWRDFDYKRGCVLLNYTPTINDYYVYSNGDLLVDWVKWEDANPTDKPFHIIKARSRNHFLAMKSHFNKEYLPKLELIGDKTAETITIESENTTVLSYTIGEGVNNSFVAKQKQYNVASQYEEVEKDIVDKYKFKTVPIGNSYRELPCGYNDNGYVFVSQTAADFVIDLIDNITPAPTIDSNMWRLNPGTVYTIDIENMIFGNNDIDEVWEWIYDYFTYNYGIIQYKTTTTEWVIKDKTPITFNYYTLSQWRNGYHYTGNQ